MNILITGGSGSYGHAFVKRILQANPQRVVVYSRDEQKQYEMAQRFGAWGVDHPSLRFFLGDVRDLSRLELAMRDVDTIIHAAALKIVPTLEYNPTECVATNIGGAENVVKAALRCGVGRVIALSTDKAVNPINLYGATKLAAEKIFLAANALAAGQCRFSVMRYGNVVGSRGSVVPFFQKLAAEGRPLPVTDERMTRFWLTLDEAVEFTLKCLELMQGREVFVPRIPSMKILDLALAISTNIQLNTGIRPGEKIHETLISEDEARKTLDFGSYFTISDIDVGGIPHMNGAYCSNTNTQWLTAEQIRSMI